MQRRAATRCTLHGGINSARCESWIDLATSLHTNSDTNARHASSRHRLSSLSTRVHPVSSCCPLLADVYTNACSFRPCASLSVFSFLVSAHCGGLTG